jgi:hypothetical protein
MSDRDLERRLRDWYGGDVHPLETAPAELRERVAGIPANAPAPLRLVPRSPVKLLAVAALLVAGGALATGSGVLRLPAEVPASPPIAQLPSSGPSSAPSLSTAVPTVSVTPTPAVTPTSAAASPALGSGFSWAGEQAIRLEGPAGEVATRLADGRVLVIQACGTGAELFDPATGQFTATGSASVPRYGFTATLLPDGRVLVAGGYNCGQGGPEGLWASAEVYDPATGSFSATGSMEAPREFHAATLLRDGRVLVTGGFTGTQADFSGAITLAAVRSGIPGRLVDTCSDLASAELYDPATGYFTATGPMNGAHLNHTQTLLQDGRVLVAGSGGCEAGEDRWAELYDPATGRFSRTGSMRSGRSSFTATLLDDGRVLVLGGHSNDAVSQGAEIYDPRARTFGSAGQMTEARQGQAAIRLLDGRVFIVGGLRYGTVDSTALSSTEIYDPATGTFAASGSMGTPRDGPAVTLLRDGRVLIVGGADTRPDGEIPVQTAVLYRP